MRLVTLAGEHLTLATTVTEVVTPLLRWSDEVRVAPGGSAWMHHRDFAERTEQLAGHLEAMLALAEAHRFPSALALTRTALEHHLIDRLLLLADRYEEIIHPADPAVIDKWERDWERKAEPWTRDVASVGRVKSGKALRLVRLGHTVRDKAGHEREQISPYWVAMEHYDAFLGHPDAQAATAPPFESPDERKEWAKRNQELYGAFLRWDSICSNLELSHLASRAEIAQLRVHYTFLSAFTHATKSGYEVDRRPYPNSPPAEHVLGELVILYATAMAVSEMNTWANYAGQRLQLLMPLRDEISEVAQQAGDRIAYFWFLGGRPQQIDFCEEANRRAHPLLLAGQSPETAPSQLQADDIGYYAHPFDRLQRMHVGGYEMTTGFGFPPAWPVLHW